MNQLCTGNPEQMWCYDEPTLEGNVHKVFSEKEIVELYMPFWSEKMHELGLDDLITVAGCIDDWIIVNWACTTEEYDSYNN